MKKDLFNKRVWDRIPLQRAESDKLLFWAAGAAPAFVLICLTLMKIPPEGGASPCLDNFSVEKRMVPPPARSLLGPAASYTMPTLPKPSRPPAPAAAPTAGLGGGAWGRGERWGARQAAARARPTELPPPPHARTHSRALFTGSVLSRGTASGAAWPAGREQRGGRRMLPPPQAGPGAGTVLLPARTGCR